MISFTISPDLWFHLSLLALYSIEFILLIAVAVELQTIRQKYKVEVSDKSPVGQAYVVLFNANKLIKTTMLNKKIQIICAIF